MALSLTCLMSVGSALAQDDSPFVDLDATVAPHQQGKFGDSVNCQPNALLCFKLSVKSKWYQPLWCRCDIPLIGYSKWFLLSAGECPLICIPVKCIQLGTYKPAVILCF